MCRGDCADSACTPLPVIRDAAQLRGGRWIAELTAIAVKHCWFAGDADGRSTMMRVPHLFCTQLVALLT